MLTKNGTDDKKTQIQLISLDQLVPEDHLLRKIDKYIDFDFIYDLVEGLRSSLYFCSKISRIMELEIFSLVFSDLTGSSESALISSAAS